MRTDSTKGPLGFLGRRGFLKTIGMAVMLAAGAPDGGKLCAGEHEPAQPNILLIITDQQFADVMSCTGSKYVKTPAMDSIAKKGVRFPNAYVNYPVCMPERYTMYTGRLPCQRHLADENNKPTISLGNQAKAGGYDTAYFGKWHVQDETFSSKDHANHGFDLHTGGKDKSMTENAIKYFSEKMREDRELRAREMANKLPVKMSSIMAGMMMPTLLLITVGPVVIRWMRTMG